MTKEELITKLHECRDEMDTEVGHAAADDALIEYINDLEIEEAYNDVPKWFA